MVSFSWTGQSEPDSAAWATKSGVLALDPSPGPWIFHYPVPYPTTLIWVVSAVLSL
ncbi:hypothetical protein GCM10025779_17980 [Arthrobacter cryoconiti]